MTETVTMPNLRWTDDGKRSASARERDFTIERRGKPIPGVVWQPLRAARAQPLVLMGHGGTGHKRSAKLLRMAEIFTGYGWWAAAIDGPAHGARVRPPTLKIGLPIAKCGSALQWYRT